MLKRHIETTSDGSKTIYVPLLDENYHSVHGALQESKHVYINAGLKYLKARNRNELKVFEMGYGTGLNAFLTYLYAEENQIKIDYLGIEKYPVSATLSNSLNYDELLDIRSDDRMSYQKFHEIEWGSSQPISEYFKLHKEKEDLHSFHIEGMDLIYYDAFAPSAQPDLWTEEVFQKLYYFLNVGGILVTYCAKGSVKRALKASGFIVQSIPGPPGKREMTRALKNE